MSENYRLREMLSHVKCIRIDHTITHAAVLRLLSDPEREIKSIAAQEAARSIVGDVIRGGTWSRRWEPEGEIFSLRGYWLTHDQAYRLLGEAYSLGRTEPFGQASQAVVDASQLRTVEQQRDALLEALKNTRAALFYQIEGKHGPKVASEYPEIVEANAAIAKATP